MAFTLKDEHAAQLQALRLASQKAKSKAEEMASALGLKIIKILAVNEGERGVRPITMPLARGAQFETAAVAPTPVEAGTIEIRSTVTSTGELGARTGCEITGTHMLRCARLAFASFQREHDDYAQSRLCLFN